MTQSVEPEPKSADEQQPTESQSYDVDLPLGRSMQPDESMEISCARPTRFIVIAGAADSGKTTLLASLHERFLRGPWAGYLFAGCATLLGFERICHPGRGASGKERPDTDRTKRPQGRQLLHLSLRVDDCSRPAQDLLLSDLSGEEFDDARDSVEFARELAIIRAAHHLLLLVDGEKIAAVRKRQQARDESSLLLRTLVEQRLVGPASRVDIVFTKWDIVDSARVRSEAIPFADEVRQELMERYRPRLGEVRSFNVAARDPSGRLPPAWGLEHALPGWVEQGPGALQPPSRILVEATDAVEYDRFLQRQLPGLFRGATP